MNDVLTGKSFFDALADGLTALVSQSLERLFGPGVNAPVLGSATWVDVAVSLCFLLLVLVANGLAAAWLRNRRRRCEVGREAGGWRARLFDALGKPVYFFIWISGLYLAATPLLPIPAAGEAAPALRLFAGKLFGLAIFIVVFWLFFRLTRVLEECLAHWTSGTESKLDDLLAPLLGRSLRVIVPVVGIILALPLLGLSAESAGVFGKASSILLIGAVAWILFQAVHLGEQAVLAKYDIQASDNLQARKVYTQVHVLGKAFYVIILIFTAASVLMLFEEVRRFGASLLASAGVVGIIAGFAAQRTISNLFAGFQIAMTQPIRIDDVVIVENEWGRIEEITLTYVVIRIWDERRLIVPLSHFIENPFQNWTRASANLLGSVYLWVDYSMPLEEVRQATRRIVEASPIWDKRFWNLVVSDANDRAMQIRVLATAGSSSAAWDLRCEIREKLIDYIQRNFPQSLPRFRAELGASQARSALREGPLSPPSM